MATGPIRQSSPRGGLESPQKEKQPSPGAMSSLVAFLLCSLILTAPANADELYHAEELYHIDCPSDMNYTSGSAFQANLDALLSSLPRVAAASSGFAENVTGDKVPDKAFGLAQCRGDLDASECRACLGGAAQDVATKCPGQKSAMVIYEHCLLRYSNTSFFGASDESIVKSSANWDNMMQPAWFTSAVGPLLGNLTEKAAYESPRRFAAGSIAVTPVVTIYGMAQCTRDLTPDDCNRCLVVAVRYMPECCDGKQGARVFGRKCYVRFEQYPFYNVSAMPPVPGGGPINGDAASGAGTGSNRTVRTALLVSVPVAVTLLVLLFVAVYICKKIRKVHMHTQIEIASNEHIEMGSSVPVQFGLRTLQAATDNFSEQQKLGQGGFGSVYKGRQQNGQNIAVKRLSTTSQQGQAQLRNEVILLAKVRHRNLVHIIGYCIEQNERLLVYEFLSNTSMDKILHGPASQQELSWAQRYKIIEGISRGLTYLHEDCSLKIIHRDLKPGNILLDANMNPKISDFGLARLLNIDSSRRNTSNPSGTLGYMAPEYIRQGIFSAKSDVYSYGILILEIITGRRPYEKLIEFVWRHWSHGNVPQLVDSCPVDDHGKQEILRCIHIGLLCIQDNPQLRPSMANVVLMLNSRSMMLDAPIEPVFATTGLMPTPELSINEASVSELGPR